MIERFEVGKWYRWVGPSERPEEWDLDGEMDWMLEGEPHKCVRVDTVCDGRVKFADHNSMWWWTPMTNFEEVPEPNTCPFNRGDRVWISNVSEDAARECKIERVFLAYVGGKTPYVVTSVEGFETEAYFTGTCPYAVPVEEQREIIEIPVHRFEIYPEDAPQEMMWGDAVAYCRSLGPGWRLPTRQELLWCYEQGVGGFASYYYWSSSEVNSNYAWRQNFHSGYQNNYYKYNSIRVRAVRTVGTDNET